MGHSETGPKRRRDGAGSDFYNAIEVSLLLPCLSTHALHKMQIRSLSLYPCVAVHS